MKMLFDGGDDPGWVTTDLTQLSCSICLLQRDTLLLSLERLQFLLFDLHVQGSTHLHGVFSHSCDVAVIGSDLCRAVDQTRLKCEQAQGEH